VPDRAKRKRADDYIVKPAAFAEPRTPDAGSWAAMEEDDRVVPDSQGV
jgi:hypothetical protein